MVIERNEKSLAAFDHHSDPSLSKTDFTRFTADLPVSPVMFRLHDRGAGEARNRKRDLSSREEDTALPPLESGRNRSRTINEQERYEETRRF